jgi:hypothetical protein
MLVPQDKPFPAKSQRRLSIADCGLRIYESIQVAVARDLARNITGGHLMQISIVGKCLQSAIRNPVSPYPSKVGDRIVLSACGNSV